MASKAEENNYRQATDVDHSCCFCILKQSVPYNWCDQVGQQVKYNMTCDRQKGGADVPAS